MTTTAKDGLEEMYTKVLREMPHVDCHPFPGRPCTCYKSYLLAFLNEQIKDMRGRNDHD